MSVSTARGLHVRGTVQYEPREGAESQATTGKSLGSRKALEAPQPNNHISLPSSSLPGSLPFPNISSDEGENSQ